MSYNLNCFTDKSISDINQNESGGFLFWILISTSALGTHVKRANRLSLLLSAGGFWLALFSRQKVDLGGTVSLSVLLRVRVGLSVLFCPRTPF